MQRIDSAYKIMRFAVILTALGMVMAGQAMAETTVFINEFHYDNTGTDTGEEIEVCGPAGTDLTNWDIVLYNGANGLQYDSDAIGCTIPDEGNGFGCCCIQYPSNGIQNGSPDGICLVDDTDAVVQFLSYEGSFMAVDGACMGETSTDIGVSEPNPPIGFSLKLCGQGQVYEDFSWTAPSASEFCTTNSCQQFPPLNDEFALMAGFYECKRQGVNANTVSEDTLLFLVNPNAALFACITLFDGNENPLGSWLTYLSQYDVDEINVCLLPGVAEAGKIEVATGIEPVNSVGSAAQIQCAGDFLPQNVYAENTYDPNAPINSDHILKLISGANGWIKDVLYTGSKAPSNAANPFTANVVAIGKTTLQFESPPPLISDSD